MKEKDRSISLTDVSSELYNEVFQTVLKNPLQGLFLTHYSEEEVLEMDTKMVLVKNKKGVVKLAAMAIKDYTEEQDDGSVEKKLDKNGNFVKEATGLFSVNLDSLSQEIQDKIYEEINSLVVEPKNYGKKDEPNLILSLLQQGILDSLDGEVRGSHFGHFLSEAYEKMGKEIQNEDGWDFDYEFLSDGAKKSYVGYVEIQMGKMKEYKKATSIRYNAEKNVILVDGKLLSQEEVKDILTSINDSIKYYETVVNQDSVQFLQYGIIVEEIVKSSIMDFEGDFTLKDFVETTKNLTSYKDMMDLYTKETGNKKLDYSLKL